MIDKFPLYLGIDQSLTHTSIACIYNDDSIKILPPFIPPKGADRGVRRLDFFATSFENLFHMPVRAVALEGYSMASRGHAFDLGELGGIIKVAAFRSKMSLLIVPPTCLKKFVTGKGNSLKSLMIREVWKKWQMDVENDNDADAIGLVKMVAATARTKKSVAYQEAALDKCEWLYTFDMATVKKRAEARFTQLGWGKNLNPGS